MSTVVSQLQQLSGAEKQYFTCVISGLYTIWKQPKLGWEWFSGALLIAERRPNFLKGPLLVSLQNSGASGLVGMQLTTLDFPTARKKSFAGQESKKKKSPHLNSDSIPTFCRTFQQQRLRLLARGTKLVSEMRAAAKFPKLHNNLLPTDKY